MAVKFKGNCLKQNKVSFTHRNLLFMNLIHGHVI